MKLLKIVYGRGYTRLLYREPDGEELWYEYQHPCLCEVCA